jgi:hypothetical protein
VAAAVRKTREARAVRPPRKRVRQPVHALIFGPLLSSEGFSRALAP